MPHSYLARRFSNGILQNYLPQLLIMDLGTQNLETMLSLQEFEHRFVVITQTCNNHHPLRNIVYFYDIEE